MAESWEIKLGKVAFGIYKHYNAGISYSKVKEDFVLNLWRFYIWIKLK